MEPRSRTGYGRGHGGRKPQTFREGVLSEGRQPRARASRRSGLRRTPRPGRLLRARLDRAQTGGIPGPTGVRELTRSPVSAGEPSLRAEMGYATRDVRREARSRVSGMGGL